VLGFGGVPRDGAPGLDHAQAGVATNLLVVGAHEFAEELDGLGDGVAEDLEAGLSEELLEALGLGAGLGAEDVAGLVELQTDVFPAVSFGAEFGDEGEQIGIGFGWREFAWGNHGKPSGRGSWKLGEADDGRRDVSEGSLHG